MIQLWAQLIMTIFVLGMVIAMIYAIGSIVCTEETNNINRVRNFCSFWAVCLMPALPIASIIPGIDVIYLVVLSTCIILAFITWGITVVEIKVTRQ